MSKTLDNSDKKCKYEQNLCHLILTQFNQNIKYDYPIPKACDVIKTVLKSLNELDENCQIRKDIEEIIFESRNDVSMLRRFLWNDSIFGHEWFYLEGDYFRYRPGKRAEAIGKIYKQLQLSNVQKIDDKINHVSLKDDVEKFVNILNKNIKELINDKYENNN